MRRPVLWAALGALAYPLGTVLGHLLFNRSVIYPHKENRHGPRPQRNDRQ